MKEGRLCPSCNRFIMATCIGYEWYEVREIRFCRCQMLWLISNLELLLEGQYPLDPYVSGYVGGGLSSIRPSAPFERAGWLAGELESRLWVHGRTGEAGEALVGEVQLQGIMQYKQLSKPAQRVLNYISGFRRKAQTYPQWRRRKNIKFEGVKKAISNF